MYFEGMSLPQQLTSPIMVASLISRDNPKYQLFFFSLPHRDIHTFLVNCKIPSVERNVSLKCFLLQSRVFKIICPFTQQ